MSRRIVAAGGGEQEPLHRHAGAQMVLILSNAYYERSFGCITECGPRDFIVRPAYFGHGGAPGQAGSRYVRLGLTDAAARRFFAQHGWTTRIGRIDDATAVDELITDPRGGDMVLTAQPTWCADRAAVDTPLECVAAALAEATDNPIEELAEAHRFTPWSLSRAFKARFGAAPTVYRQQARLQRAMKALAETSAPFARIALDAGFADQSHFNRVLRVATGLTPGETRRALAIA
jgi:AraC family transcriptional regulator